jgi:hypothetical protein
MISQQGIVAMEQLCFWRLLLPLVSKFKLDCGGRQIKRNPFAFTGLDSLQENLSNNRAAEPNDWK